MLGHKELYLATGSLRQQALLALQSITQMGTRTLYSDLRQNSHLCFLRRQTSTQNGKPDYVLYIGGTRQTVVWYMNNNVFLEGLLGPTLPAGWNLIDVADFNSDGNPDYLLFKPSNASVCHLVFSRNDVS